MVKPEEDKQQADLSGGLMHYDSQISSLSPHPFLKYTSYYLPSDTHLQWLPGTYQKTSEPQLPVLAP